MDATPRDIPPPPPPPIAQRPWWSAAGALLATLGIVAASAIVPIFAASLVEVAPGRLAPAGEGVGPFLIFMGLTQIVMLGGTVLVLALERHRVAEVLALGPPRQGWRDYALGIGLIIAIPVAYNAIRYFGFGHDITADLKPFVGLFRNPWWVLAFVVIAVGAPVAEEVLFRGYLLPRLMGFGFAAAAILSTLVWAFLHAYSAAGMALIIIMGVLFADLRRRTGSLRVPMAAHAVNNLLACLYLQFGPPIV